MGRSLGCRFGRGSCHVDFQARCIRPYPRGSTCVGGTSTDSRSIDRWDGKQHKCMALPRRAHISELATDPFSCCRSGNCAWRARGRRGPSRECYRSSIWEHLETQRGYRKVGTSCERIGVLENGYLPESRYGKGRESDRGFADIQEDCVAVTLPVNADLEYSWPGWKWGKSIRKQQDRCLVP